MKGMRTTYSLVCYILFKFYLHNSTDYIIFALEIKTIRDMDNIKKLSIRIEKDSERAKRAGELAKAVKRTLPNSKMALMDELLASGNVYELPLIPYTGPLADKLFFVERNKGGYTLYMMNGYLQKLAVVEDDNTANIEMEHYKCYIANAIEWIKNHR